MACPVEDLPDVSLLSLEEDLTCSICLSLLQCPVTTPCGHNYCQTCLLSSWRDSYCCPQCRTVFATKPELKKNTVLSTVVEAFHARSGRGETAASREESRPPREKVETVLCDACMEAEASKTCLTCMASYCEEHLRPHRDNPVFRLHQLGPPVADLSEHICPDHHKLMELFCGRHERSVCSLCLHQEHKGCSVTSLEEQRSLKESDLRNKLSSLNDKIQKTSAVLNQLTGAQSQLKEAASDKKKSLAALYRQIQDMLAQDEREAQREVDRVLEMGEKKFRDTMTTLSKNSEKLVLSKETINSLLAQTQGPAFLKTSFELPKVAKFEPHLPRVTLDSDKLKATQTFASALKESLTEILKEPVEARPKLLTSGEKPADQTGSPKPDKSDVKTKPDTAERKSRTRSKSAGRPLIQPQLHPHFNPQPHPHFNPQPHPHFKAHPNPQPHPKPHPHPKLHFNPKPHLNPHLPPLFHPPQAVDMKPYEGERPQPATGFPAGGGARQEHGTQRNPPKFTPSSDRRTQAQGGPDAPSDSRSAEKRSELLKHGVTLTFDPYTAHRRVVLSEAFTKASVSEEPRDYPDCPQRFAVCTQVLAVEGFSRGRHYWEVRLDSPRFVGVGLAYGSVDRKGPAGRLGRNGQSWCVEWFNDRTSAWHDGGETQIAGACPRRVGVLLDYEEGTVTLFRVADGAFPLHTFVFPFAEPVYPAFWIFSSDSAVSICNVRSG